MKGRVIAFGECTSASGKAKGLQISIVNQQQQERNYKVFEYYNKPMHEQLLAVQPTPGMYVDLKMKKKEYNGKIGYDPIGIREITEAEFLDTGGRGAPAPSAGSPSIPTPTPAVSTPDYFTVVWKGLIDLACQKCGGYKATTKPEIILNDAVTITRNLPDYLKDGVGVKSTLEDMVEDSPDLYPEDTPE